MLELTDRDGLDEGDREERDGFGLMDGDLSRVKEQSQKADSVMEDGASVVMILSGGRVSNFDCWKKFSTLLLRITDLNERERFSFWIWRKQNGGRGRDKKRKMEGGREGGKSYSGYLLARQCWLKQ